jgi:hypothetical protein
VHCRDLMLANQRIEPSRLRRSAVVQGGPFTSLFVEPVHSARQHTNLRTVTTGSRDVGPIMANTPPSDKGSRTKPVTLGPPALVPELSKHDHAAAVAALADIAPLVRPRHRVDSG